MPKLTGLTSAAATADVCRVISVPRNYWGAFGVKRTSTRGGHKTGFMSTRPSPAGVLKSVDTLAAGSYRVSFYLAGNLRGAAAQTKTVTIGGDVITLTPDTVP